MNFRSQSGRVDCGATHGGIINLEGNEGEVLRLRALGTDLGIEIRVDDAKTGIVIKTRDGMYRQAI